MFKKLISEDSPFRHALFAVAVGIVAGLGAVAFRAMISFFHNLFFYGALSLHYDANVHSPISPWGAGIILVPVAGSILVAFLVKNFAPEAKGHGVPEVMDAVHYQRGIIRPLVAIIKSVASAISIGTGGAIGREGPIIQIGAAFGSTLGQILTMPVWQRIILIACGAGGGIAATFNTPIGGLLFAIELILPEISARTLIPVAIATGTSTFVGRLFFGDYPAFDIPALALTPIHANSLGIIGIYVLFGLILGAVSVVYIRAIYVFEDVFNRIPGNYYTRHALGMLLVGIMMYLFVRYTGHYYVQGVGYAAIQDILTRILSDPTLLLLLFAAKLLATCLTLGSGASGGIFSPSLFMGATLGAAYAVFVNTFAPGIPLNVPASAIIGMAAVVGGATGAVVTAIVMIFEMTRDYNVIVPLMIVVSVTYGVRRVLLSDSIYTLKLTRRGHVLPESLHSELYMLRSAGDVLFVPTTRVANVKDITGRRLRNGIIPHALVIADGKVISVLPNYEIRQLLHGAQQSEKTAAPYIVVGSEDIVFDVVARMRQADVEVALVSRNTETLIADDVLGVLTIHDIARHTNLPRALIKTKTTRPG